MTCKSTETEAQLERLLQLLQQGPRTTIELRQHAIMMPAARIFQLRHELNYDIKTELVAQYDTEGVLHSKCARYHLVERGETMTREVSAAMLRIMDEVERMDAHEHTKRSLKAFINEACLVAGITVVDRRERVRFARRLLDDGEPRPTIRDRLMVRFSIKRASAYAVIDRALQLSSSPEKFWTNGGQTEPADTIHSRTANERFSER